MEENPFTSNEYTLRDSLQAVEDTKSVPNHLFSQGFRFVSFHAVSLFTNDPLDKTVDNILKQIFKDKIVQTTKKKRTLKKLILDSCTKTTLSFKNQLYKQIDGVSMGSSLGPILANIILTEFEKLIDSESNQPRYNKTLSWIC